jgi:hypothetical protein
MIICHDTNLSGSSTEITDITVSNRHLKIRSVLFKLDHNPLPPLVYVDDISLNGTFLRRLPCPEKPIMKTDGPLLLNDGDILRLGASTLCTLRLDPFFPFISPRLTDLQELEYQVVQVTWIIRLVIVLT